MNRFPEKFRFSFIENEITTYCKYAPEEWNDNVIKWSRDKKSEGILTKYINDFTFVMEDADFLKTRFETTGVFSKVRFVAEEYDSSTFQYKSYYSGDIDFYSYEESQYSVKVAMLEVGFKVAFDTNYDTTYEIEIPTTADQVEYDRLNMNNKIIFSCEGTAKDHPANKTHTLNTNVISSYIFKNIFECKSVVQKEKKDDDWFIKTPIDINVTISAYGTVILSSNLLEDDDIRKITIKLWTINRVLDIWSGETNDLLYTQWSLIYDGEIKANEEIFLTITTTGGRTFFSILDNSQISISYNRRGSCRTIRGLRPLELLNKLISKATDNKFYLIKSTLLTQSDLSNMLITSGSAAITFWGIAKIKTSLKEFFESFRVIGGASYTFDVIDGQERLVVEKINDMFKKNSNLITIDDIKDFKRTIANSYIYNRLRIGYKDQNIDDNNSNYEFNTELLFTINSNTKNNELKLISPYRADMYGIESMVHKIETQGEKDSNSENDIFILHTNATKNTNGLYNLNRTLKVQNSPAGESAFNVYLSPRHCLMRQIEYIKSIFKFSGTNLEFISSPKNFNMISEIGGEHQAIALNNEHNDLFTPVFYEFETMVPSNISELITTKYNGYVEFKTGEKTRRGFVYSLSENPGRNKSQSWKLLAIE